MQKEEGMTHLGKGRRSGTGQNTPVLSDSPQ